MGNIEQILHNKINELLSLGALELRKINPVTDQVIVTNKQKYFLSIWTSAIPGDYMLIVVEVRISTWWPWGSRSRRGVLVKPDGSVERNDKYNNLAVTVEDPH
jgi:hypothetical protein